MVNIEDRTYQPNMAELDALVSLPLFTALCRRLESDYAPRMSIEYSGDKVLLGWNVKMKKAGRTLCTLYPRQGHFFLLLVVGRRESERVNALLPSFGEAFRSVYESTQAGMGQRWMLFDFPSHTDALADVLTIVRIRRES